MDQFDVLSEVFGTLRIRSQLYFRARFGEPAAVRIPPEARHIRFHLVLRGACAIRVGAAVPVMLAEGDIALVPNGASQVLSSGEPTEPVPLEQALAGGALRDGVLAAGPGATRAELLCGFCQFDEGIDHPVLASLPPLIHLRQADLGAEPWVAATLRLLALEANLQAQGTTAILGRLIEIVAIQATRRLTAPGGAADGSNGFLAALADPALAPALLAMHRAPAQDWRVDGLARLAGMSRARFAERFLARVGVPPIEYLTAWRLMRARALLAETDLGIEDIAARCGYASLPSFTRRFKARFAVGPGAFRRARRGGAAKAGPGG